MIFRLGKKRSVRTETLEGMTNLLLDSNIIIGLAKGRLPLSIVEGKGLFISDITRLEVLGYHKIKTNEEAVLQLFFKNITIFDISNEVITRAIHLRKEKSMSVGDAIIAATALIRKIPLVTVNIVDFRHVQKLTLINPEAK